MLRFSVFIIFVTGITCCILISTVSSIPPPPPPPPICRNGEVLSFCYNNPCVRRYCVEKEPEQDCKLEEYCRPGCLCKEGHLRAQNGTCVPHDECPPLAQESSAASLNSLTKRSTSEDGSFNVPAIPIQQLGPIVPFCGENEMISMCSNNNCQKMSCDDKEPDPDCELQGVCSPGCLCQDGYLRALNGTCVPKEECPEPLVCGENEEYSSCFNGGCFQTNCTELGRPPLCRDLVAGACLPGCICKYGHLRNATGTCVPTSECPKNEVCSKPNEYYDPCPPSCPDQNCRYYEESVSEACPPQPKLGDPSCYPSCRCKEGFYKNYNQDCVSYEDCSKFCTGINEYLVAYPETCEPETCDSIKNTTDRVLQSSNKTCNSECQCFPGLVRNKRGQCIDKKNCDKCQGPNEYFACREPCDNVCATLHKVNQTNCPMTNDWFICVDMCYCDEGYARDANNICIPIADCPNETE
ncbi:zonadhesin-like [Epargyreus clarus]|uniref:zonadhesin-like n=1 Tax=Epargyreus clarus TaxID=520877 RepID=UPI003C2DBDA3